MRRLHDLLDRRPARRRHPNRRYPLQPPQEARPAPRAPAKISPDLGCILPRVQQYNRSGQVVIGAIESIDMFVFEHKNVFVPEASLDVPM